MMLAAFLQTAIDGHQKSNEQRGKDCGREFIEPACYRQSLSQEETKNGEGREQPLRRLQRRSCHVYGPNSQTIRSSEIEIVSRQCSDA